AADPAAVAALVQRCAYLPLAVRIAAERVASHPHQTVADLVADLASESDRLELLSAADDDTMAVRAAFSWSYRALEPDAARMFRLLGLHPGPGFCLDAASALAGIPPARAARLLDTLTQAHLLEQSARARFGFHDLLRVYAAEQAAAAEPDHDRAAAVDRLAAWYLHTAVAAGRALTPTRAHHFELPAPPDGVPVEEFGSFGEAFAWCEEESVHFAGIVELARAAGLYEVAWRIAVSLLDFFLIKRPWRVWIDTHEAAVAAAREGGDRLGEGWALINLGEAHRRRGGEPELAEELFTEALRITRMVGDLPQQGWALCGLGYLDHDRGQFSQAATVLEEMLAVDVEAGYTFGQATARVHLGRTYRELGDLDVALAHGQRALEIYQELDDRQAQGFALVPLARTHAKRGELSTALDLCDAALDAYRAALDRWGQADALDERGRLLSLLGKDADAQRCWDEALDLVGDLDQQKADRIRQRQAAG
ncbi:tetratricopeptide repeat protein, partial [Solihabitans fulvus]